MTIHFHHGAARLDFGRFDLATESADSYVIFDANQSPIIKDERVTPTTQSRNAA